MAFETLVYIFIGIPLLFDIGKAETGNVCYQKRLTEFTESSISKYETLMDAFLLMLEEQKICKCLKDRVTNLERENARLRHQLLPGKDCTTLYDAGERVDKIYNISPDGRTTFPVYCDMTNGGWTIIQRRVDGAVNFDRVWIDYARGFGNLSADFWLGLRFIYLLANRPNEISFEFTLRESGGNASAVYKNFTLEDEDVYYRMHVSQEAVYNNEMSLYITNANGFLYHNGMQFTTKDSDHDRLRSGNCAQNANYRGGFWYKDCYTLAGVNNLFDKMSLYGTNHVYLSKTEVKIRKMS